MILVIDNYDSFTFNLVQYLGELGAQLEVFRNDAITVEEIAGKAPSRIIVPGTPLVFADVRLNYDTRFHDLREMVVSGGLTRGLFTFSESWYLTRRIAVDPPRFDPSSLPGNQLDFSAFIGNPRNGPYGGATDQWRAECDQQISECASHACAHSHTVPWGDGASARVARRCQTKA